MEKCSRKEDTVKFCTHVNCTKIYTKENGVIIDTKYQCHKCGEIISIEEYQDIRHDNCEQCNGSGTMIEQGELYICSCVLL